MVRTRSRHRAFDDTTRLAFEAELTIPSEAASSPGRILPHRSRSSHLLCSLSSRNTGSFLSHKRKEISIITSTCPPLQYHLSALSQASPVLNTRRVLDTSSTVTATVPAAESQLLNERAPSAQGSQTLIPAFFAPAKDTAFLRSNSF